LPLSRSAARRWCASGGLALRRQRITVAFQFWLQKLFNSTGSSIAAIGCSV
jgi:hypothetical protein